MTSVSVIYVLFYSILKEVLTLIHEIDIEQYLTGSRETLARFVEIVLETRAHTNIIGPKDAETIWREHLLDAASPIALMSDIFASADFIVDIGSGGGFPGLVLPIIFHSPSFALIESTGKKASFLRNAAASLGLSKRVTIYGKRAEELSIGISPLRAADIVTARALSHTAIDIELMASFAALGGRIVLWKGPGWEQELSESAPAMETMGCEFVEALPYSISGKSLSLVVFIKKRKHRRGYPRGFASIKKTPLLS